MNYICLIDFQINTKKMQYFNDEFIIFFQNLAQNNNREWFLANKKTYENLVKSPFLKLVDDLISKINSEIEPINLTSKDCIFRINRDVRFAKEKQPYKTNISALINQYGKKDKENPGMYLEINADMVMIYGGCFMPAKENLDKIRWYIMDNKDEFEDIINEKNFVKYYKEILGEKNKIIPKEFKEFGKTYNLIYNKQFFYNHNLPHEFITSNNLLNVIYNHYLAGNQLQKFLVKALNQ